MKIDKSILETLLKQGLSTNQIGKELNKTGAGVRYVMKKHNLSSDFEPRNKELTPIIDNKKKCSKCQQIVDIEKYSLRSNGNLQSACNDCNNIRRYAIIKANLITLKDEFGGKCIRCGYNNSYCALDFHHLNPEDKSFSLSSPNSLNIDKLRLEANKCILLCANCHREEHYNKVI